MPTLKVTDTQVVSYEEYGAGPGLMLVHGSPGSASAWQPVGQRLSDRFRIVAPNLPGYGGTSLEEPGGPDGVPHAAGLLESLIRETGVPDVLAGHSYGGAVALTVALRGHVKPRALALFEPVCTPILLATGYESRRIWRRRPVEAAVSAARDASSRRRHACHYSDSPKENALSDFQTGRLRLNETELFRITDTGTRRLCPDSRVYWLPRAKLRPHRWRV